MGLDVDLVGVGAGAWNIDPLALASLRLEKASQALARGDADLALVEAEELLESAPNSVEALAVVAESALMLGDAMLALAALATLEVAGDDSAKFWCDLSRARFLAADLEGSLRAARAATERAPDMGDAWLQQALSLERLGRPSAAALAWQHAATVDAERFSLPPVIAEDVWQSSLDQALLALPQPVQAFYLRVPIAWAAFADVADLVAVQPPLSPLLDGMYSGTPPSDPEDRGESLPDCVRLFRGNLRLPASNATQLTARIHATLVNEAADWLGLPITPPAGPHPDSALELESDPES